MPTGHVPHSSTESLSPSPGQTRTVGGPSRGLLNIMIGLSLVCLGLAGILAYAHVSAWWAQSRTEAPFCGAIDWLGCDSVLNSRFAYWRGIPVVWPALVCYSLVIIGLIRLRPHPTARRNPWPTRMGLSALAWAMLGAAGWFTWVQVAELGTLCLYCSVEHLLGSILAVAILWTLRPAGYAGWVVATTVGLGGAGLLAAGQLLDQPQYAQTVAWQVGDGGQWTEAAPSDRALRLLNGKVVINRDAHPILGSRQAERLIVEVADFSCIRCAKLDEMLISLKPRLGDHMATLIVFFPLDARCNPIMTQTPEGYEDSCDLVRLAAAVWLADPDGYAAFHHWLFENQEQMTTNRARHKARQLIGAGQLDELFGSERVEGILRRDIELARALMTTPDDPSMGSMPGLIIGDHRIEVLPDRAETLWHVLRVFSGPSQAPPTTDTAAESEN